MEKPRRKTVQIPDEGDAPEKPKGEPFVIFGDPADDKPVRVGTAADGSPLYAPPRSYWIKPPSPW